MRLDIHIDGGSRGNPGPAACGVVIRDSDSQRPLHEAGYHLGQATNNVAEYSALLRSLQLAQSLGAQEIRIFSDSELMVRQITGQYRVKSADLRPLYEAAQMLLLRIDSWQIKHVLRAGNARADELANAALDAGRDVIVRDGLGGKAGPSLHAPAASPVLRQEPPPTLPQDDEEDASPADAQAEDPPSRGNQPPAMPTWVATVIDPGDRVCPAPTRKGQRFEVGPGMPAGLCVFAAEAILDELPLRNPQSVRDLSVTTCPRCGACFDLSVRDQPA